jgi:hypothetical protein
LRNANQYDKQQRKEDGVMSAKCLKAILCAIGAVWAIGAARADVVYTYTGKDYTTVSPQGIYTTLDQLIITLTYAAAIPANTTRVSVPITWTFNDGVNELTQQNTIGIQLALTTDGTGDIVDWIVGTEAPASAPLNMSSDNNQANFTDYVNYDNGASYAFAVAPGQWTVADATAMPEPSSFALSALALTALGWIRTRRSFRTRIPRERVAGAHLANSDRGLRARAPLRFLILSRETSGI